MAVLDFNKAKQNRSVVKPVTKLMFIYRKLEQFVIDHDRITGKINTLQDIQNRIERLLDRKIKTIEDIDKMYYSALGVARRCK